MKRFLIILVVLLCFAAFSSAESWRVFDNAGLFTAQEIAEIEQAIFSFQRKTNFDFAVLTTDDYIGKKNQQSIADSFYISEDFGFGIQASGMLYYLDMSQYIPYITTCGSMVDILDSDELNIVHSSAYPSLETAQYKDAVIKIIESTTKAVATYKKDAE